MDDLDGGVAELRVTQSVIRGPRKTEDAGRGPGRRDELCFGVALEGSHCCNFRTVLLKRR